MCCEKVTRLIFNKLLNYKEIFYLKKFKKIEWNLTFFLRAISVFLKNVTIFKGFVFL